MGQIIVSNIFPFHFSSQCVYRYLQCGNKQGELCTLQGQMSVNTELLLGFPNGCYSDVKVHVPIDTVVRV